MTLQDAYIVREIQKYTIVDNNHIATMQNFLQSYINENIVICRSCPAQIRYHHQTILDWANANEELIQKTIEDGTK